MRAGEAQDNGPCPPLLRDRNSFGNVIRAYVPYPPNRLAMAITGSTAIRFVSLFATMVTMLLLYLRYPANLLDPVYDTFTA